MSRAAWVRSIASGLGVLALAVGFALGDQWPIALAVAFLGGFWFAGQARGWRWTPPVGPSLILVAGSALLGGFLSPGLALAAVVLVLAGWDLDRFTRRLGAVENVADPEGIEKRHLLLLLAICLVSLTLGAVGLLARVRLGFWLALFLMTLAILGFSQLIGYLRHPSS